MSSVTAPVSGVATESGRSMRRLAFLGAAAVSLAVVVFMSYQELLLAATGWFADLGIHQIHDLTIFSMLWFTVVAPLALMLYRPDDRVNAALAPLVVLLPLGAFAYLADSPILMLPVVFGALSLVVFALHPAGRDLLRFDRVANPSRLLGALVLVAAVPLAVYAFDQFASQLAAADEHALFVHYAAMGIASVYVVLMGAMAVLRRRDWRFAAWSAGLVAVVVGAASIVFAVESSAGDLWGAAAIVWALAFVAAAEYVRGRDREAPRTDVEAEPVAESA